MRIIHRSAGCSCSSEVRLGAPSLPSSTGKMVGSRAGREDLVDITIQIQYLKYCDRMQFFNEGGISQKFPISLTWLLFIFP